MAGETEKMEAKVAGMDASRRVSPELAKYMRETRVAEAFKWIDSVVIGPGAAQRDPGWFNTWNDFATASDIVWHTRRNPNVGKAYTNRPNERLDYAFDLYRLAIGFRAPIGYTRYSQELSDQQIMPLKFTHELPTEMSFSLDISSTDNLLEVRGDYAGAGAGPSNSWIVPDGGGVVDAGNNGVPYFKHMWSFPEPVMVPAGATLTVTSRVNDPIKQLMTGLNNQPGFAAFPFGAAGAPIIKFDPCWYVISVVYIGARYLQVRGARSAPGSA